MWIFLGITAFLAAVIFILLMLPIHIIIKTDEKGELFLRYTFLGKVYGENPDPNNPLLLTLKKVSGVSRLEKGKFREDTKNLGVTGSVSQYCRIIIDLLREICQLIGKCTAKRFLIEVVCSEENAADTAISYGRTYAVLSPIVGILSAVMKIRKKGQQISVTCDYSGQGASLKYDFLLRIRLHHALAALLRITLKEARRTIDSEVSAARKEAAKKPAVKKKNNQRR